MFPLTWYSAVSPGAAFIAGVLGVAVMLLRGRHRLNGAVQPDRITAAAAISFGIYSLFALVIAQLFNLDTLSSLVQRIGNDRVAILFVAVSADLVGRYLRLVF